MQTNCYCLNWEVVDEHPDAQDLDEFLSEEESEEYKKSVPNRIWLSDSTAQYHYMSEVLAVLAKHAPAAIKPAVQTIASCICFPLSIDELGLGQLPDSYYFASISPERVEQVLAAFKSVNFQELASLREQLPGATPAAKQHEDYDAFVSYLEQWRDTLGFAAGIKYGLIGATG